MPKRQTRLRAMAVALVTCVVTSFGAVASPASAGDSTVTMGEPVAFAFKKDDGVNIFWTFTKWLRTSNSVRVNDPGGVVASVQSKWIMPGGDEWYRFDLERRPRSSVWAYDAAQAWPGGPDDHVYYGTWTIADTAYDADGNVLATSQSLIEVRDPYTAIHPKIVSLRTKRIKTRARHSGWYDSGAWWINARFKMVIHDPDEVLYYALVHDKVANHPESSAWFGADVTVSDDGYVTFKDDLPVRDVAGVHELRVRRNDLLMAGMDFAGNALPRSYVRGVPFVFKWRLRRP